MFVRVILILDLNWIVVHVLEIAGMLLVGLLFVRLILIVEMLVLQLLIIKMLLIVLLVFKLLLVRLLIRLGWIDKNMKGWRPRGLRNSARGSGESFSPARGPLGQLARRTPLTAVTASSSPRSRGPSASPDWPWH